MVPYLYRGHADSTTTKISLKNRFDTIFADFSILKLAKESKLSKKIISACENKVLNNI
jgi:hypothetical protein